MVGALCTYTHAFEMAIYIQIVYKMLFGWLFAWWVGYQRLTVNFDLCPGDSASSRPLCAPPLARVNPLKIHIYTYIRQQAPE